MKSTNLAKAHPEIGHSTERLYEDRKMKQKHRQWAGKAMCERCGAVWMGKHWYVAPVDKKDVIRTELCPGCQRVEQQLYEGEVFLKAPEATAENEDMMGLLNHTESRAYLQNPKSRIALIEPIEGGLHIVTTSVWLANRIGKEVANAFKGGQLDLKRSPGENFIIVRWEK